MPQGFGNSQTASQEPKPVFDFWTKHPVSIIKNPFARLKDFFSRPNRYKSCRMRKVAGISMILYLDGGEKSMLM